MRLLRLVLARLRALVRRDVVAREIREEMQFHLDQRAEEYQGRGAPADEARRAATRRFGNVTLMRDRGYDVRGGGVMETILQDVRYGVRLLARHPGFSLLAVLTLGLGMGASTALFSVTDAVILRALPYSHPEEMVTISIEEIVNGRPRTRRPSPNDIRQWRSLGRIFVHVGAGTLDLERSIVEAPAPERVAVGEVSEDFLEVYGIGPHMGRTIGIDDLRVGAAPVVLLGHRYWLDRFAGDADVVGRGLRIDGQPATIIGVLPAGFYENLHVWRPSRVAIDRPDFRGSDASVHGRLRSGLSPEQAARELPVITRQAAGLRGDSFTGTVLLRPMHTGPTPRQVSVLGLLSAAVGLVLLIACTNVAGLLLARGAVRQPELAVRAALGAGRLRLVRQLFTESLVLSFAGTAVGLLVAWLSLDALVALVPLALPPNSPAAINGTVLAAAAGVALALPLLFGLVPALCLSRVRIGRVASLAARRHGSSLSRRGGQILTAVEVALAIVLLAGAGLLVRSFHRLTTVDLGFDPGSFLTMDVMPVDQSPAARAAYYPLLVQAIRAVPGVVSAGAANVVPLQDRWLNVYVGSDTESIGVQHVTTGYFESIGLRPVEGRLPNDADLENGRAVLVANQSLATRLSSQGTVLGQRVEILKVPYEVIGVVPDLRRSASTGDFGRAYLPYAPHRAIGNTWPLTVVVRPAAGASHSTVAAHLRQAAHSIGPPVVVERIRSGHDWLGDQVATPRKQTLLLGLLGTLALLLTLVGIFSVTAFAVARRTHEIGVRMAFGAQPRHVVSETVRETMWPVAAGLAAGVAVAFFATRAVASMLFETTARDPITFAAVAALLGATALLAAWLPARRAARVNPVVALRTE